MIGNIEWIDETHTRCLFVECPDGALELSEPIETMEEYADQKAKEAFEVKIETDYNQYKKEAGK